MVALRKLLVGGAHLGPDWGAEKRMKALREEGKRFAADRIPLKAAFMDFKSPLDLATERGHIDMVMINPYPY